MESFMEFTRDHTMIVLTGAGIVVGIILYIKTRWESRSTLSVDSLPETEEDDKPDMTRITILASDGKVIEEVVVETDSIDYDNDHGSYLSYENAEGKDVSYLLGTHSAKITDL